MSKRIYFLDLRNHDLEYDDDLVREIEMIVDSVLIQTGYAIQFWRDVAIYGIDEALLYLKNAPASVRNESLVDQTIQQVTLRVRKAFDTSYQGNT